MSQHDFNIANQTFSATRTDLNNAFGALATNSAGNSEPSTTYASQWWFDSDGDQLYIRNKDNDAWVKVFKIGATSDLITELATDSITIAGSTPTLTIGDGGAEDTKILFDGNAQNFYIGLDDSADDLLIGLGSTVGTTPAIAIDENNLVTLPDGHMVIASTAAGDNLTLKSTNAGAEAGPQLVLHRDSASPANNDVIGRMRFEGEDNESNKTVYAQLTSQIIDKGSSGGEDSTFQLEVFNNGALRDIMSVKGATNGLPEVVFNESSQDVNFRIETDGNTHMFFVDGGNNAIGIGTSSPGSFDSGADNLVVGATDSSSNGITIASSTNGILYFADGTSGDEAFRGSIIYNHANDNFIFRTAGFNERMRIASDGKISMGHAGTSSSVFHFIRTSGNEEVVLLDATNASYAEDTLHIDNNRAATTSYNFVRITSGGDADSEFIFQGSGNAFADGSFSGGGADYAEYFEWKDGNSSSEDRRGYSVVLDGNKIVKATDSDDTSKIIGVISANPAVVGDSDIERWKQKHLTDDYGSYIFEDYTQTEWTIKEEDKDDIFHSYQTDLIPDGLSVPNDAIVTSKDEDGNNLQRRKLNPDWNKDTTYISRSERKEWDTVGLMGKLRLRKGQPTGTNWIKMRDISDTIEEWLIR